jgi:hypothetical protein
MPTAADYQRFRNSAGIAPALSAARMATPGYAAGMDQASLAGLAGLIGHNPLRNMPIINSTPGFLENVADSLQNQAQVSQAQNQRASMAGIEAGESAQDYLNHLAQQTSLPSIMANAANPNQSMQLGNYLQQTTANANQMSQGIADLMRSKVGGHNPLDLANINLAGANQLLSDLGTGTTSPTGAAIQSAQNIQNSQDNISPQDRAEIMRLGNKYTYGNANLDPQIAQNAFAYKQKLQGDLEEMRSNPFSNPENISQNVAKINTLINDPETMNTVNGALKGSKNYQDFLSHGVIQKFAAGMGLPQTQDSLNALSSAFSSNPQIADVVNNAIKNGPTIDPQALKQALNQVASSNKLRYYDNYIQNSILQATDKSNQFSNLPPKISELQNFRTQIPELTDQRIVTAPNGINTTRQDAFFKNYQALITKGFLPETALKIARNYTKTFPLASK